MFGSGKSQKRLIVSKSSFSSPILYAPARFVCLIYLHSCYTFSKIVLQSPLMWHIRIHLPVQPIYLFQCMIKVDISGHPPFPTGSKQLSGNLLFLAGFNFRGHFEGPNEGFSRFMFLMIAPKMNLLDNTFPMSYHTPKTEIVCKSYDPEKLMYSLTQTEPT